MKIISTKTKKTSKPSGPKLHTLIKDLSSDGYHGTEGTWSSSQLKDILKDEELFIKKYITKEIPRKEMEAFDTGTYFHTAVLEPHKVKSEITTFPGKVRFGKAWDKFKEMNKGKVVITPRQREQGDTMIKAVQNSPIAQEYLVGNPEVSLFVKLVVYSGDIYAPHYGLVLTREGWECRDVVPVKGYEMIVKVRADMLGKTFVTDLKSTSGMAKDEGSVRHSISKYQYDLSAALYLDLFSLTSPKVQDFYWIFASKETGSVATWRASYKQILVGRAKYMKAIKKLADCAKANWEIVDSVRVAEPLHYELEWLQERDDDLL
jgi:hypothetical protein